jgi:hypothetical protein
MSTHNIRSKSATRSGIVVTFVVDHGRGTKTYLYPFSHNPPSVMGILTGSDPAWFYGVESDGAGIVDAAETAAEFLE